MIKNIAMEFDGRFKTFKLDKQTKRIINLKFQEDTNIDEFMDIQSMLNKNEIRYKFDKNFDIQLV